jgi:adenylosuccinate synthase
VGGVKYDFHVVPSGIISPNAISVVGNGVVIHLEQFFAEIDHNIKLDEEVGSSFAWPARSWFF